MSFEIARWHRFHREMAEIPDGVVAHVLPTGGGSAKDDSMLPYRSFDAVNARVDKAYEASRDYLLSKFGEPEPGWLPATATV